MIDDQIKLFDSPKFNTCMNRKGIRKTSGILLEQHFCQIVIYSGVHESIEIGAHEASYSKAIKAAIPTVDCIAFEANPYVFNKYKQELNQAGVDYHNLAISNHDGEVELKIPVSRNDLELKIDNAISSIFDRSREGFKYKNILIKSVKLKSIFSNKNSKALWIDVEGGQLEVLSSFGNLWESILLIYIEVENADIWINGGNKEEIYSLLANKGFIEVMRDNLSLGQYNTVFIKESLLNDDVRSVVRAYIVALQQLLTV